MDPFMIALFGTALVLVVLLVSMATTMSALARWRGHRHCLAAPSDSYAMLRQRRRQFLRAALLLVFVAVCWVGMFALLALLSQVNGLITGLTLVCISSIALSKALEAFCKAEGLNEADPQGYEAIHAMSDHKLVSPYLAAVRAAGRNWITQVECQRLANLVAEDEMRRKRSASFMSFPGR